MKVIAITGMPLSGKGELINYVYSKYSLPYYTMGRVVKEEVARRGLPEEKAGIVASEMRAEYGPYIWAKRTLENIKADSPKVCLIDGVRSLKEVDYFKEKLGADFYLVAVHAKPAVRSVRMNVRARADDLCETLASRDRRELGWGIGGPIAMADCIIVNETNIDNFKLNIDKVFLEISNGATEI